SIPAIIGAMVLQTGSEELTRVGLLPLASGFVTAVLVGLIALRVLMGLVRRGHLYYFAPYCWAVAAGIWLI
ncbi:MAG: undecaprenyl-diphosphate phosphatase, partial [Deltaproteobacteria bacterium]|nr:undecaprenyl-diphosphate phosphatase [Deltaproteobacteria bacterium]